MAAVDCVSACDFGICLVCRWFGRIFRHETDGVVQDIWNLICNHHAYLRIFLLQVPHFVLVLLKKGKHVGGPELPKVRRAT